MDDEAEVYIIIKKSIESQSHSFTHTLTHTYTHTFAHYTYYSLKLILVVVCHWLLKPMMSLRSKRRRDSNILKGYDEFRGFGLSATLFLGTNRAYIIYGSF